MDVYAAIKKRRSIRKYKKKAVNKKDLRKILAAAKEAPSASNRQEWRFIVVKDEQKKQLLYEAAKKQEFIKEAPIILACCADTDGHIMTCGQACYPIDLAIAIDHMTLAAISLGLGTCWVGAFYEDQVRKILNIPEKIRVVELLALGYPAEIKKNPKNRLSLKQIVFFEEWGKS
ncbi:MAG: nitroreductase family protein [Candidatus Omnitrophica bacterium]|jgi:nitroreductase|nr:nitroreductase family protein [Candidatus Omnitrophota bacterium]